MKYFFSTLLCLVCCSLVSCKQQKENQQASNIAQDNKVLLGSVVEFSPEHQILVFKLESSLRVVVGEELEVHRPMQGKLGKIIVSRIDETNNVIIADTIPASFSNANPDIHPKDTIYRVRD